MCICSLCAYRKYLKRMRNSLRSVPEGLCGYCAVERCAAGGYRGRFKEVSGNQFISKVRQIIAENPTHHNTVFQMQVCGPFICPFIVYNWQNGRIFKRLIGTQIICSAIWSLCMKMNVPQEEAELCVEKVRERQMGYWSVIVYNWQNGRIFKRLIGTPAFSPALYFLSILSPIS